MARRKRRPKPFGCARDPSAQSIARAARHARHHLADRVPLQSAKRPAGAVFVGLIIVLIAIIMLGVLHIEILEVVWLVTSYTFAMMGIVRVCACLFPGPKAWTNNENATPEATPMWTILVALYKEADSVPSLLVALSDLKWAPDRLDIIFACEDDDTATLEVLASLQSRYDFRVIKIPKGGPRTKPNALQTALPFARGRFLTVYDAEDRPDPQQLRAAFDAFIDAPPNLAVLQSPLVAWNHSESWITRQFALDYAIWYRVLLPAFTRISGLILLGGTSNHFRTEIVRAVGGWDPYNVTEDADLGVRLARYGYRAGLISPPTYEEAPPRISAWVKQRGRWIQGHIQTFCVHLRSPTKLLREIGERGLAAFFIGLGLGPMSAIIVLPLTLGWVATCAHGTEYLSALPLIFGFVAHVFVACVACRRDTRLSLMSSTVTLPLYHGLQSLAACRAMWRVVFTPSFWDKTDHGCAARVQQIKGKPAWVGHQL
jgi:glycosyltransferase XagB